MAVSKESLEAAAAWKAAGEPTSGPLFDAVLHEMERADAAWASRRHSRKIGPSAPELPVMAEARAAEAAIIAEEAAAASSAGAGGAALESDMAAKLTGPTTAAKGLSAGALAGAGAAGMFAAMAGLKAAELALSSIKSPQGSFHEYQPGGTSPSGGSQMDIVAALNKAANIRSRM